MTGCQPPGRGAHGGPGGSCGDSASAIRHALDSASFHSTPVREAGKGKPAPSMLLFAGKSLASDSTHGLRHVNACGLALYRPRVIDGLSQRGRVLGAQACMRWWARGCRRHTSCTSWWTRRSRATSRRRWRWPRWTASAPASRSSSRCAEDQQPSSRRNLRQPLGCPLSYLFPTLPHVQRNMLLQCS